MIRLGEVHIVGTFHERGERRAALICIPIQTQEPRALIVLENVPVPAESEEDIFRLLREVVMHTEELISTEEGVVAQELLYQLKMRVTDQIPQLVALPPVQRAHAALELALQNLAAEVAIWIPRSGGRPISTEPRSPRAIAILGQVRWSLDRIVQWVNENGSTSVGIGAEPDDAAAPVGPVPYIGVTSPDNEGVLVAFFPDEGDRISGPGFRPRPPGSGNHISGSAAAVRRRSAGYAGSAGGGSTTRGGVRSSRFNFCGEMVRSRRYGQVHAHGSGSPRYPPAKSELSCGIPARAQWTWISSPRRKRICPVR
jgi:hypothetical protein